LALVICSRTNLHTAQSCVILFVWDSWNSARLVSGVTLNPAFIQVTRVDGYLRNFFVPLSYSTKEVMCPQQHITSFI